MDRHDAHTQLVRDQYLKEIHEKMLKHNITFDELTEFAGRYISKQDRMKEIRESRLRRAKQLAGLEKARQTRHEKSRNEKGG